MKNDDVRKVLEKQLALLSKRIEEAKSIEELCSLCDMALKTVVAVVRLDTLDL